MTAIEEHVDYDEHEPATWPEEERTAWRIWSDRAADWAMRKLARAQQERARIITAFDDAQADLTERRNRALAKPERDIDFFTTHLAAYHADLFEQGRAGTSYPLAYGTLTSRALPGRIEVTDEAAFREWAEGTNRLDLLRVKVEPDKQALKALPAHDDGRLMTGEGELVPGVVLVAGERSFTPKPATQEQPAFIPRPEDDE